MYSHGIGIFYPSYYMQKQVEEQAPVPVPRPVTACGLGSGFPDDYGALLRLQISVF